MPITQNPSQEEAMKVAERFNMIFKTSAPPSDVKKLSCIDVEDDYTLPWVDVPTREERNNES